MIIQMTHSNMTDYKNTDDGFTVLGRIIPTFENNLWAYTEVRFTETYFKQYENDEIDSSYVEETGKKDGSSTYNREPIRKL